MEPITGYSDLSVPFNPDRKELRAIIKELDELGYRNIAIDQTYDATKASADKSKRNHDPIPEPVDLKFFDDLKTNGKLRLFNRLSIVFSDNSIAHFTGKSANFRKYHIVAAVPTTESALQFACQTLNCDLVSYGGDAERLKLSRAHYFNAVDRNVFFELRYAAAIGDAGERRALITRAHRYHAAGKSRNVLLVSGATDRFLVRAPHDVANLALIFGLSEEQGKDALLGGARRLLIRAETRRHGKAMVFMKKLTDLGVYDSDEISDSEEEREKTMEVEEASEEEVESMNVVEPSNKKQKTE